MEKEQDKEGEVDALPCPSFNSYTSDKLAGIAERVSRDDHFGAQNDVAVQNDETDFEFVAFRKAADGVFFDGDLGPVFPVFNRDLLTEHGGSDSTAAEELQFPMRRLLIGGGGDRRRERDPPVTSSESESEADDLEGIPAGTYCVWTPNASNSVEASPSRCKKSNSTGSSSCSSLSKRWKLLDLLRRSNSEGKDSFVFLTPSPSSTAAAKKKKNGKEELSSGRVDGGRVAGKQKKVVSAHEALYVRNRELRRVDKRKSYLPYRQDLVGFCASLSSLAKAFPSF